MSATVDRILDVAEKLFAEHGFAETSLRAITSKAEVNLAAVNYHFGSKKSLIQAVFSRFLDPFVRNLSQALVNYQNNNDIIVLEEILHLLVDQIMAVKSRSPEDLSVCMRLIGLAYMQGHLKEYLQEAYGEVFWAYLRQLEKACPDLPMRELFWRVYFILGSAVFTLSGANVLRAIAESDYGVNCELEEIMRKMVPFMAAGLRAHT